MAKLTLTTFLSLDGVMQGPGGPEEDPRDGFDLGGWLVPYADEDMARHVTEWFGRAGAFLLGRVTYEIFAAYWPQVSDEEDPVIARRLNALPKYVATTTLNHLDWKGSTPLGAVAEDTVDAVRRLKEQPGDELQIHGSGDLARSLMEHDLIDEYRLLVYPVVLGRGRRLFADGAVPTALRLLESDTTPAGVAVHTYAPDGRPTFGTM
ncbi:dihydrofolate reductase family protein [Streptomyces sp. NBC_01795]|uniref:dihydrofolate reductase family protein n=1 Tax=unclassified Streptomyces TaxID=2593676 RepID=UPI002DD94032|nr:MULTISPECIES: dihydrofolate reductase family protein [unclassified Streptomyces]WSA95063.1 dihydrofolate reductase family protein [Streptomyces sp. NBC_01795]WSB79483.1 dihydrofolate reductase family protein [Streptomyces sp. NBC_01775]WSS12312.1 dihydrofolate reductase family protein [Streptomyces sp. NBC_01186]